MAERFRRLNLKEQVSKSVNENSDKMADLQREQLMKGLGSDGKSLLAYKDDPFFKSQQSAEAYSRWKKRLHPESPEGISNMNITGYYHGEIKVLANGSQISVTNTAPFAASADAKNRGRLLGYNKDSCVLAWRRILRAPTVLKIAAITGCKIR